MMKHVLKSLLKSVFMKIYGKHLKIYNFDYKLQWW